MASKDFTRVTVDLPTVDHKKLKMLAAFHGKSMREIFVELIETGLAQYQECTKDHTPNATTKKAIEQSKSKRGVKKASSIEELFEKLSK